jgi:hypothetical protein
MSAYWLPHWQVCLCVLLIALVVYNPFAALSGSPSHLSYETPARHRASVGSSELQHFSPVPNPGMQGDLDVVSLGAEILPCKQETPCVRDRQVEIAAEPMLTGVWSRPPPSR